jgi:hypothetical protein
MKYIISENRMIRLVDKMVQHVEPEFNVKDAAQEETILPGENSYILYYKKQPISQTAKNKDHVFARYYVSTKVLELNTDLFFTLEDYFGDEMTAVIDWFNQEFNQDAETVNY